MGKKNDEKQEEKEKPPITNIDGEHKRLADMRERIATAKDLWTQSINQSKRQTIINDLRSEVSALETRLRHCKPAALGSLQGQIEGIELCIRKMTGEYWLDDLAKAERELKEFEKQNGLFLAGRADKKKGNGKAEDKPAEPSAESAPIKRGESATATSGVAVS